MRRRRLIPGRVKAIYTVGEDAPRLASELGDLVPVEPAGDLTRAVELARRAALPGDTVLLSPACASFDQFRSFEHRGDVFREAVRKLSEGA
jgi:UDP-N-acetylmuramoylalanine--D-glutamate ligase